MCTYIHKCPKSNKLLSAAFIFFSPPSPAFLQPSAMSISLRTSYLLAKLKTVIVHRRHNTREVFKHTLSGIFTFLGCFVRFQLLFKLILRNSISEVTLSFTVFKINYVLNKPITITTLFAESAI